LKPANIFISEDGVIKIGDFGLAGPKLTLRMLGTKVYAAPEMFSSLRMSGSQVNCLYADIWSVGVTFYFMMMGYLPFNEKQINELGSRDNFAGNVNFHTEGLNKEQLDLLNCIFKLDPSKRPTAAELCNHPYLDGWKPSITENGPLMIQVKVDQPKKEPIVDKRYWHYFDEERGKYVVKFSFYSSPFEDNAYLNRHGLKTKDVILECYDEPKEEKTEEVKVDVTDSTKLVHKRDKRILMVGALYRFKSINKS
jgi:serine/threonine protein kinase